MTTSSKPLSIRDDYFAALFVNNINIAIEELNKLKDSDFRTLIDKDGKRLISIKHCIDAFPNSQYVVVANFDCRSKSNDYLFNNVINLNQYSINYVTKVCNYIFEQVKIDIHISNLLKLEIPIDKLYYKNMVTETKSAFKNALYGRARNAGRIKDVEVCLAQGQKRKFDE